MSRRDRPTEEFLAAIGARVRQRREELGYSLQDVRDRCDVSVSGLWQVERGRSEPGAVVLSRLARVLGVSIDWIVLGEEHGQAT